MKLRGLLALVLAAIMVMGLAACGGGKTDEPGALNIFMWSEYLPPTWSRNLRSSTTLRSQSAT